VPLLPELVVDERDVRPALSPPGVWLVPSGSLEPAPESWKSLASSSCPGVAKHSIHSSSDPLTGVCCAAGATCCCRASQSAPEQTGVPVSLAFATRAPSGTYSVEVTMTVSGSGAWT
jgi:hypothetical protein